MGRKANPIVIGSFVVAAIALAVLGVLIFGSGQLFRHTSKYVCFFPGAVDGLAVGAPVRFKGVDIGSVTEIRLRLAADQGRLTAEQVNQGIRIPVTIEIDHEKMASSGGQREIDDAAIKELVDLGLRAQLNAQSLVTGLLFVQLDFHPELTAEFVLPADASIREIPTIPTTLEQVQSAATAIIKKLEELHFDRMVNSVNDLLDGVNGLVRNPQVKATVEMLPKTVENVNTTLASIRSLAVSFDGRQGPLLDSLRATSESAAAALKQARSTFETVQVFIDPNSTAAVQLSASLEEIASAARAVRLLADYLERNPGALVRGKQEVEAK